MRFQRRPQLECLWLPREIPQPDQPPIAPTFVSNCQLIARDVEGRTFPAIGRLHLDHPIAAIGLEAQDVICSALL